jgi:DNA-binding beta-propeller fold protein YncE
MELKVMVSKAVSAFLMVFSLPLLADNVYISSSDTTLYVLDTATLTLVATAPIGGIGTSGSTGGYVAISPNGSKVFASNSASPGDGTVTVIDANSPYGVLATVTVTDFDINATFLTGIAIGAEKGYVASRNTGFVYEFDTTSYTVTASVGEASAAPNQVALTPDGQYVYVANTSFGISVIQTDPFSIFATITAGLEKGGQPRWIAISPDGTLAYVGYTNNGNITVIDTNTKTVTGSFDSGFSDTYGIAFSPEGEFAYLANLDSFKLTRVEVAMPTTTINTSLAFVYDVASSDTTDGVRVVTTSIVTQAVNLFDADISAPLVTTILPGTPYGLAFIPSAIPPPSPPTDLSGTQRKNNFGLTYEEFNKLNWKASPSDIAGYHIYRDGTLIASVTDLEYEDHNRSKGVATTYGVTAFDSDGIESDPIEVTIQ